MIVSVIVQLTGFTHQLAAQIYRAIPGTSIRAMAADAVNEVGDIASAAQLTSGSIVIADNTNSQLHFYTAGGRFVRTVGRRGAGPGEFQSAEWIGECGRDSVYVFDHLQKRISVFSLDGKLARVFAPPAALVGIVRCTVDGTMLYVAASAGEGMTRHGAIQTSDNKGKLLYRSPEVLLGDGKPLGRAIKVAIGPDGFAYGDGDSAFVTTMTASGTGRRLIPAGRANRAPTDANRNAAIEFWATVSKGTEYEYEQVRGLLRKLPPVKTLPAYSDVFIDATTKALWVKTSTYGDPGLILERHTLDGTLQGSATLPAGLEVQQIRGDVLIGVLSDAKTGDQMLVTYRLVK